VLHDERAAPDPPQRLTALQGRDLLDLGLGEAEQLASLLDLAWRLPVDDPRLGVLQQPLGELEGLARLRHLAIARWLRETWKLARQYSLQNVAVMHRLSDLTVPATSTTRASSLTSRRLNTTSRPDRSSPGEVGPSNTPRRSPAPMRRNDSASWRPSSASRAVEVRSS